jgi:hypothetical protein
MIKSKELFFSRDWINYLDIKNYGFDGQYFDSDKNVRKKWDGQFWYQFSINIDGKGQFDFRGSVCSIVCDEESAIFRDKKDVSFLHKLPKTKKVIISSATKKRIVLNRNFFRRRLDRCPSQMG